MSETKRKRGRPRANCPPKVCVCCGATFERREGECSFHFYARSTCSRTCARRAGLTPIRKVAEELGLTRSQVCCALGKAGRKLAAASQTAT